MCRHGNPDATPTVRVLPSSQDCRKLIVQGGKGGVVNSGIKHSVITPKVILYITTHKFSLNILLCLVAVNGSGLYGHHVCIV